MIDFIGQKLKLNDNSSSKDKAIICVAEIFGTAILLFMGCLSTVEDINDKGIVPEGFAFGLAIMIATQVSIIYVCIQWRCCMGDIIINNTNGGSIILKLEYFHIIIRFILHIFFQIDLPK